MTNTLGIMLEILNNYPWTRLSVRIIGVVTQVFDNSNFSQEIFAIDTWEAVIGSFGHGRKHMLRILPTKWRPGFRWSCHQCALLNDLMNLNVTKIYLQSDPKRPIQM